MDNSKRLDKPTERNIVRTTDPIFNEELKEFGRIDLNSQQPLQRSIGKGTEGTYYCIKYLIIDCLNGEALFPNVYLGI